MKPIILLYTLVLALFTMSCDERNTAELAPEYLFDAGNQQVIKSIINNKKGTIAMLYGNDLALESASDSLPKPNIGAQYTLVTWKQKPMPQWYGANMNGEIYSIETLKVRKRPDSELTFDYDFQTGKSHKPGDRKPQKDQQIQFMISQRAAIFP